MSFFTLSSIYLDVKTQKYVIDTVRGGRIVCRNAIYTFPWASSPQSSVQEVHYVEMALAQGWQLVSTAALPKISAKSHQPLVAKSMMIYSFVHSTFGLQPPLPEIADIRKQDPNAEKERKDEKDEEKKEKKPEKGKGKGKEKEKEIERIEKNE